MLGNKDVTHDANYYLSSRKNSYISSLFNIYLLIIKYRFHLIYPERILCPQSSPSSIFVSDETRFLGNQFVCFRFAFSVSSSVASVVRRDRFNSGPRKNGCSFVTVTRSIVCHFINLPSIREFAQRAKRTVLLYRKLYLDI